MAKEEKQEREGRAEKGRGENAELQPIGQSSTLGAKKTTPGVFDNNLSALHCYESAGFKVTGASAYIIDGEEWTGKEMELFENN